MRLLTKLLAAFSFGCGVSCWAFASVANDVDDERIKSTAGRLIDNFTGLQWVNNAAVGRKMTWQAAREYCEGLVLEGFDDYRLPTYGELRYLNTSMDSNMSIKDKVGFTWSSKLQENPPGRYAYGVAMFFGANGTRDVNKPKHFLCVRGPAIDDPDEVARVANEGRLRIIHQKHEQLYAGVARSDDIAAIEEYIQNYPDSQRINDARIRLNNLYAAAYSSAYAKADAAGDIKSYDEFVKKYPGAPQSKAALESIAKLVASADNVAGYEWYITNYPETPYTKEAVSRLHEMAYVAAKKAGTVSALNTFILSFPTARQVSDANKIAYELEREEYTDIGFFGFIGEEEKMERQARSLLIKGKQMERAAKESKGGSEQGRIIIANRMYDILQNEFSSSEATLRHLESEEFKDFVRIVRNTMADIARTLKRIEENTERMGLYTEKLVEVAKEGFSAADADRDMAAYYTKEHRNWEKFMHFKDRGYN